MLVYIINAEIYVRRGFKPFWPLSANTLTHNFEVDFSMKGDF
jgi:hypothetical protein